MNLRLFLSHIGSDRLTRIDSCEQVADEEIARDEQHWKQHTWHTAFRSDSSRVKDPDMISPSRRLNIGAKTTVTIRSICYSGNARDESESIGVKAKACSNRTISKFVQTWLIIKFANAFTFRRFFIYIILLMYKMSAPQYRLLVFNSL